MTGQKGHNAPASKKLEKKPKPKDNTSRKKTVVLPRFDDGICKQCKSTNMVHESIHCNLCNELFHVACFHKNGVQLKDSICTTEFRDIVRPMISNNVRWGHFMFMCENCYDFIHSLLTYQKIHSVSANWGTILPLCTDVLKGLKNKFSPGDNSEKLSITPI